MWVEQKAKVDDPVGAVAVHGANGLWGVLALGLFADGKYGDGFNGVAGGVKGLFYGDAGQFGAQLTDAVTIVVFCSLMTIAFFTICDRLMGIRSRRGRGDQRPRHAGDGRLCVPRLPRGAGLGVRIAAGS